MSGLQCSFAGCSKRPTSKGLCSGHNAQRLRGKALAPLLPKSQGTITEKYEAAVIRREGCWGWGGTFHEYGYGLISKYGRYYRAHRVSWELHNGPIPDGMEIDHICHTPECTKPAHLRLATKSQNMENRRGANSNNKLGVRNVAKHGNMYRVTITKDLRQIRYGSYATLEEAARAAVEARAKYFPYATN